jgi:hypothetical protein
MTTRRSFLSSAALGGSVALTSPLIAQTSSSGERLIAENAATPLDV